MKTKLNKTFVAGVILVASLQNSNAMQDEKERTGITITYHGSTVNNQAQKIESSIFEPWPVISIAGKKGLLTTIEKLEQYGDTVRFEPSKQGTLSSSVFHYGIPPKGGMFEYTSNGFFDIPLPEKGKHFGLYVTLNSTEEKNWENKNIAKISYRFVEIE